MWGTTSFCDELTDDFGGAFEATSIDGCRLFCCFAEKSLQAIFGVLQHNPRESGSEFRALQIKPTMRHSFAN
jgi:hypothetical protein